MQKEIWKDVPEYEGLYQVSNYGRVLSTRKKHLIMKLKDNGHGYFLVGLWKNKKCKNKYIHRLVAESYIPNLENNSQVNHKDGIKSNNHVENIEWCNQSQNNKHAYKLGLRSPVGFCTPGSIDPKRKAVYKLSLSGEILEEYPSVLNAAQMNNLNSSRISRVCNGIGFIVKGFTYKFK